MIYSLNGHVFDNIIDSEISSALWLDNAWFRYAEIYIYSQ